MKFFQKLSRKKLNPNSSSSKLRHVNTIDEISSFGSLISSPRDNQRQKLKQKQKQSHSIPSPHIPDIIDLNTVPMSEIYYNSLLTSLIPDQSSSIYSSLQTNNDNDTKYYKRPPTEFQTKRQYEKEGIKFQQHKSDLKLLSPLYTHSYE